MFCIMHYWTVWFCLVHGTFFFLLQSLTARVNLFPSFLSSIANVIQRAGCPVPGYIKHFPKLQRYVHLSSLWFVVHFKSLHEGMLGIKRLQKVQFTCKRNFRWGWCFFSPRQKWKWFCNYRKAVNSRKNMSSLKYALDCLGSQSGIRLLTRWKSYLKMV